MMTMLVSVVGGCFLESDRHLYLDLSPFFSKE